MEQLMWMCGFQAGLDIGELILAVNNDTLLGASYDTVSIILRSKLL